jgi:hypothetical protein
MNRNNGKQFQNITTIVPLFNYVLYQVTTVCDHRTMFPNENMPVKMF